MPTKTEFQRTLDEAVEDMLAHGFDNVERVEAWTRRLREAARRALISVERLDEMLKDRLAAIYRRMVERDGALKFNQGVERFTYQRIKPKLRAELDRRIMASANLIRLNRDEAIEKTLRRFQGWSTSLPPGGVSGEPRAKVKANVKKAMQSLPFEERRVLIDQGHKLVASINDVIATDGGAIAARWRSNWRQAGYDYREDHKERDGRVYLIRDSWASRAGLVKPARGVGHSDDITQPGQEVFCRCYYIYFYNLADLPDDMLTAKGKAALSSAEGREEVLAARTGRADESGLKQYDILVHNGYTYEYKAQIEATSVAEARRKWIARAAPSDSVKFRVSEVRGQTDAEPQPLRDAYFAGRDAFLAGEPESANPYSPGPDRLFDEWLRGYKVQRKTDRFNATIAERRARRTDDAKMTKPEARYVGPGEERPHGLQCNLCTMFRGPSTCTAVEGDISSGGYCRIFEFSERMARKENKGMALKAAFLVAEKLDKLNYMKGVRQVDRVSDRDQWHAQYDQRRDQIMLQAKLEQKDPVEQVRVILHEAGHRGQLFKDVTAFDEFKRRGLVNVENFLAMANKTHREDYQRTGKVEDMAGEEFAESYSRACLGLPMPAGIKEFWDARLDRGRIAA